MDGDDDATSGLGMAQLGVGRAHDPRWVTHHGGTGDDEALALSASEAGVLIAGQTRSSWFGAFADQCRLTGLAAGQDCGDAFVLDTGSGAGVQFGTKQTDEARGIAASGDTVYVTGTVREAPPSFAKDAWAMAWPRDFARRIWDYRISTAGEVDELSGLAVDGDVFLSGGTTSQLGATPHEGDSDAILVHLSKDGETLATWQRGTEAFDTMTAVAVSAELAVGVGHTGGAWAGAPGEPVGKDDAVVVVMQRSPDALDERCRVQLGTRGLDSAHAVVIAGDGVYVAGSTDVVMNGALVNGGECNQDDSPPSDGVLMDSFVARYDLDCNHVWTRQFGTKGGEAPAGIATDGQHVFVVGTTGVGEAQAEASEDSDGFLRAYDLDGELVGEILFASPGGGSDGARAVQVFDELVHVAGFTSGELGPAGSAKGGRDAWVAAIPLGEVLVAPKAFGSGCP